NRQHCIFSLKILLLPLSSTFPYTTLFRSRVGKSKAFHLDAGHTPVSIKIQQHRPLGISQSSFQIRYCLDALKLYFLGMCRLARRDRKSTRLNSSHVSISYAVFCLKKKKSK